MENAGSKTSLHDHKTDFLLDADAAASNKGTLGGVHHGETLVERLNLLQPNNPYLDVDERSHIVHRRIGEKFKNTPKTTLDKFLDSKPEIEKRLEQTDTEMADLLAYGDEIITNIKVAGESRERIRREFELSQRINLENGISSESIETKAHYDDIVARWSELEELNDPMTLFTKLEGQKDRMMELLRSKDDMIAKCQQEIDRINDSFKEELLKQQTDICATVERVNAQINLLQQAYSQHMSLLEDTLKSERETIALKEHERWQQFYETARSKEIFKLDMTKEKKLFYANEIKRITRQQNEITRLTRQRLEKESETFLFELRSTKSRMLMNSEKLDYNYQVLQKRNLENVVINNQQKRRVGKLNEAIVNIKNRIKINQTNSENSISKLTNDIQKLHDSISELENKNDSFQINNRKKLLLVWDTNFQELKALIERVFDIDRMLHEELLGMKWQKPAVDLEEFEFVKKEKAILLRNDTLCSIGSMKRKSHTGKFTPFSSGKSAQNFTKHGSENDLKEKEEERIKAQRIEKRLLRNILRKIADHCGFLVEDRLLEFLVPYTEKLQSLVRIDNIFSALRLTDMPAVNRLFEYFKPYAWCPNCMNGIPRKHLKKLYHPCRLLDGGHYEDDDDEVEVANALTYNNESLETIEESINEEARPCDNHYLIVETALVLTALNEFVNQGVVNVEEESKRRLTSRTCKGFSKSKPTEHNPSDFSIINNEIICNYWRKFQDYMPEKKIKLWHSLEHGLLHYLDVLKRRDQLDKECVALRRQNAELKHLLQKFDV